MTFGPLEDQAYASQTEDTPKYIQNEDLIPLETPEQDYKRAISYLNSSEGDGAWVS